jgi:hypothetical protein
MRRVKDTKPDFITAAAQHNAKPKPSARPTFTSVYTDMQRDCKFVQVPEAEAQGSDSPKVCKGFGGYRISVGYAAWSAAVAIERVNRPEEHVLLGEDYGSYGARGEKVEWRLADGKPFAVIIRFGKYGEPGDDGDPFANRTGSRLVVKGLKGWEHIASEVDGSTEGANEKARRVADENYSRR